MMFSIAPMSYTDTPTNTVLTMVFSIEPNGYTGTYILIKDRFHRCLLVQQNHFHFLFIMLQVSILPFIHNCIRITPILPMLKLLFSSFHLKYIFLFSHHDLGSSCFFEPSFTFQTCFSLLVSFDSFEILE